MLKRVGLILTAVALLAAAAVMAATAAHSKAQASDIVLGWDGDQSGPTVSAQSPIMHAIEAYFKMVNDAGGVANMRICEGCGRHVRETSCVFCGAASHVVARPKARMSRASSASFLFFSD